MPRGVACHCLKEHSVEEAAPVRRRAEDEIEVDALLDQVLTGVVAEIADQSAEMAAIIDDLLVAARSSFESVPMSLRRIELHQEALAVAATVGPRLTRAPEFSLGEVEAYADPIRVRQVIRNLLTNAVIFVLKVQKHVHDRVLVPDLLRYLATRATNNNNP